MRIVKNAVAFATAIKVYRYCPKKVSLHRPSTSYTHRIIPPTTAKTANGISTEIDSLSPNDFTTGNAIAIGVTEGGADAVVVGVIAMICCVELGIVVVVEGRTREDELLRERFRAGPDPTVYPGMVVEFPVAAF